MEFGKLPIGVYLEHLRRHPMPELVSDECLASLANVERVYGATPSALAGLEVRLGEPERYADYFFLADTNEVPLVGVLWHEIDYEQFARGDSIVPCLFANTGLWQFPVDSYDELWDQILVPFLGSSRTRLLRPALDAVTASLPEHAFIKHLGTMTGRGELDRVRLAIVFSQWDDMYEGLRSIGWPGDVEAFREAIEPWRELGSVAACVDVAQDGVQPKLGVELLFPRRHPVLADVRLLGRIYRMTVGRAKASVVILPTYDCNFRCPYCYESNRLGKGREWLSRTMAPQTIDAIFSAVDDLRARGYVVSECSLFGGESLLASNRATVQAIARRAQDAGLTIAAVTNGYDLDAFLDLMEECEFSSLQVTVDGVREVHDRRRVHLSDGGTYDRILRNIGLALDRGVKVSVRVNVDKHNLAGMRDLVADFAERGLVDETRAGRNGFSYYFKATEGDEGSDWCVSEREILDELLRMGFSAGEAIEREGQYLMFARALCRTLRKESLPPIQTAFCGAETGTAVVDPFGRLFTCIDRVTYDDAVVGRLNEEEGCIDWSFQRAKWRTRTSDLLRRCQTCPYVFVCQGGCASQAKRTHGTYFREECGSMPETFDYVASHIAGDAWAREGDDELSLSWAEPLSLLGDEGREAIASTTDKSRIARILEGVGAPLAML